MKLLSIKYFVLFNVPNQNTKGIWMHISTNEVSAVVLGIQINLVIWLSQNIMEKEYKNIN